MAELVNSDVLKREEGMAECRICRDEDQLTNMESPCSCSGSIKYAHRKCVQQWCNQKGDTICEICLQPYKGGFESTPRLTLKEQLQLDGGVQTWGPWSPLMQQLYEAFTRYTNGLNYELEEAGNMDTWTDLVEEFLQSADSIV
ncbi:unnamed protein product [Calypogeia fissa]